MKGILLICMAILAVQAALAQATEYKNGRWWINKRFTKTTVYAVNGNFSFRKPGQVESSIDLQGQYCIPPLGDAHTHNLDGVYGLEEMVRQYLKAGVFYVQVLGNYSRNTRSTRAWLAKAGSLDVTYANGLLTATYGHGFYPYEPLAMGIYSPIEQFRYADSIKKSRIAENDAYYFLDSIADVDAKWPLIMKYKPDHIKICLLDAANFDQLRKAEKMETYGLSPAVAEYIVRKAHAGGFRVFAHIETAEDGRLAAAIGVDALAHMPGYGWNGETESRDKYCMTKADIALYKKAGMTIIPTMNINATSAYDSAGRPTVFPERYARTLAYEKEILPALYKAGIPLALGSDYYGKTIWQELDSILELKAFNTGQILDIVCRQTPRHIFPGRKIGEIKEGFEASFLALKQNPLIHFGAIRNGIELRVRQGKRLANP